MKTTVRAAVLGGLALMTFSLCRPLGSPSVPQPPAPTPPAPTSGIRFLGGTLAAGSTVQVSPLLGVGQQAPQLSFTAAITLDHDLSNALVRSWVNTPDMRCMGAGLAAVTFQSGRERAVTTPSLSNPGPPSQAVCPLPYDTSIVEVEVLDGTTVVLQQQFPVVYHFVRAL